MHEQNMAILKSLVVVAWADGRIESTEREVIQALLQAFEASPAETAIIEDFVSEPKTLDDLPLGDLSMDDRRSLLQHAVFLTYCDGEQHEKERALLDELAARLRVPEAERKPLLEAASERARRFLDLL